MVFSLPDPEYWKKLTYSKLWAKHKTEVQKLKDKIIGKFPELEKCIKMGLGAESDEWLKIPPDEKGEPDFEVFWEYKNLFYVEVSGSDKITMDTSKDIWIRPDKFKEASSKKSKYWFYMVYKNNGIFVLDTETVEKFKDNIIIARIKPDPQNPEKKVPERYIAIPCSNAVSEDAMFNWIQNQIRK